MTLQEAIEILIDWKELNAANYQAFCDLSSSDKRAVVQSLLDAQQLVNQPQSHWAEKALVWERWQELRSKYALRMDSK